MAYTTTFTCDRCGTQAVDDQKFLSEVGITLPELYSSYGGTVRVATASWCSSCITAMGLQHPKKTEVAPAPKPSFEDAIREIIREEVSQATA